MTTSSPFRILIPGALLVAACGGSGPDNGGGAVSCTVAPLTELSVGQSLVLDAVDQGCVRLPAAGAAGAEHLYVAVAGEGTEVQRGVKAAYRLTGAGEAVAVRAAPAQAVRQRRPTVGRFHDGLRSRERGLARGPRTALRSAPAVTLAVPPAPGHQRTFKVCETPTCETFVDAAATAEVVGERVAIYLDDEVPPDGYTNADLSAVAALFDDYLYPLDTLAFGRESDIDDNDVVIVLLTPRVNQLSPNCNTTGSIILGYFFGLDLLPSLANSNAGEIFYGLVPDPTNSSCSVSRANALGDLPGVFVHEFQHMINFNERVLVRAGTSTEDTWLNEGLSHFAEELAGRSVPDELCPVFDNCETQFIGGNVANAFEYLADPEAHFLIEPGDSQGEVAERGANWLFVRWLVDHFAEEQPLGHDLTRRLVRTVNLGSASVETETGEPFDELVAQWQLANYAEDLADFTPLDPRLQYPSWALRELFELNYGTYPLQPEVTAGGGLSRADTLRGGSGVHLRVVQSASGAGVELRLTGPDGDSPVNDGAKPRIALLRIR